MKVTSNSDIKDSFKKFSLPFRQAKMVFVIAWFLNHFTLEYVRSVNSIWIITPADLLHLWVTNFKTSLIFFKMSILTLNNVMWVGFSAILFDETQQVVKKSTTGYVPVCCEIINFFIEPQNFLLMFLIFKLKCFYLIVMACDGLLMFFLNLFNSRINPTWHYVLQDVFLKCLTLVLLRVYSDIKGTNQ